MGLDVDVPKGTFYVWTPTPDGMKSAEFVEDVLEKTGVVVTPGSATDPAARASSAFRSPCQTRVWMRRWID